MKRSAPLVALALLLAPARAAACSCLAQTLEQSIAAAGAIFEGRVAAIEPAEDGIHVRFDVVQTWRGANAEHVEVITAAQESACGYGFRVGESYLVYADDRGGALHTSICSRTRLAADAGEDRVALGSGTIPVDIADEPDRESRPRQELAPRGGGCAGCSVRSGAGAGSALGLTLALGLAVLAAGRRRIR